MTTPEFRGLLNNLRARFDAAGVAFAIGGSFALAARGHVRATTDLDVMVLAPDLGPVHRALEAPPSRFEYVNEVTFRDEATGLLIDVIPVEDEAQRAVFEAARKAPIVGATDIPILTAEGTCLMLLRQATIEGPGRGLQRIADINALSSKVPLDWTFLRAWAVKMGYEKAYALVVAPGKPPA